MPKWKLSFVLLALACFTSAQQEPLDKAIQAAVQTNNTVHYREGAAAREQALTLLQQVPPDSPRFEGWVQQVAQLYQASNLNVQARSILQQALARVAPLGETNSARIALLTALGNAWQQDGNLLKGVGYLEQAAAAREVSPPQPAEQFSFRRPTYGSSDSAINAYMGLCSSYFQLGWPEAVAAAGEKIRVLALAAHHPEALARFHEQFGRLNDALAVYQDLIDQSTDPLARANWNQAVANIYARQERYADAAGKLQEAISQIQMSPKAGGYDQTFWMGPILASYLRQAGQTGRADQVYAELLRQSQGGAQESQLTTSYAQYLADSERASQADQVLNDYLASHPALNAPSRSNLLYSLVNLARRRGDGKAAEEYQQSSQGMQPARQQPPDQLRIAGDIEGARTALTEHRVNDAYALLMHTLDSASLAEDGQQIDWQLPQMAALFGYAKEPAKAEELFRRQLALAQNLAPYRRQPLINATSSYATFLANQAGREGDVPAAIEQYRRVLLEANGPESATLLDPLRTKISFERLHAQWPQVEASVRELLDLQQSLSGNTSQQYLRDLQLAARTREAAGDQANALATSRKTIPISDLLARNDDGRQAQTRMDTAMLLARMGQFEEAETLAMESLTFAKQRQLDYSRQLEQIRLMKRNAALVH